MLQLFRLFTSFRTYVALVAVFFLVMSLTKIDVSSFRRVPSLNVVTNMKQGDNVYISQQKIADQSVLLAYVNITLWHGGWSSSLWSDGSDIQGTTIEKAVSITKYLNGLRQTNILEVQNKNPDWSALGTIVQQWNALIQQGNLLITPLTTSLTTQQSKLDLCTTQKKQADDNYNVALKNYNSTLVEKSTTQAQEASACMSSTSVAINSTKGVLTNLQSEIIKNQQYLWLITTNKSLLMQYGNILWTEVPVQLVDLQKQINAL